MVNRRRRPPAQPGSARHRVDRLADLRARTHADIAKRRAEGKTDNVIRRLLKCYIARELYRCLTTEIEAEASSVDLDDRQRLAGLEHLLEYRDLGARVQRPLWASTDVKNPAYRTPCMSPGSRCLE
jgi:hypothetical protein